MVNFYIKLNQENLVNINFFIGLFLSLSLCASCSKQTFTVADWIVKEKKDSTGPGPNFFSSHNVKFNEDKTITLIIDKRDEKWYCGEIYLQKPLGYGEYKFSVASPLNNLDKQMVLGFFLYHYDTTTNVLEEIDVELLRHLEGHDDKEGAFTVHQKDQNPVPHFQKAFHVNTDEPIDFTIDWRESKVGFTAVANDNTMIADTTYTNDTNIPGPKNMILHINFYLFQGKPPVSGNSRSITIKEVSFCH